MYRDLISSETVHGDRWAARIRREHERHAGIPSYGYCPGRDKSRPVIREITSAMLARQRRELAR